MIKKNIIYLSDVFFFSPHELNVLQFTVLICLISNNPEKKQRGRCSSLISQMRKLRFKEVKVILPRSFSELMPEPEAAPLASYFLSCDSPFADPL